MTQYYKAMRYDNGAVTMVDQKPYDSIGAAAFTPSEIRSYCVKDGDSAVIVTIVKAYRVQEAVVEVHVETSEAWAKTVTRVKEEEAAQQ